MCLTLRRLADRRRGKTTAISQQKPVSTVGASNRTCDDIEVAARSCREAIARAAFHSQAVHTVTFDDIPSPVDDLIRQVIRTIVAANRLSTLNQTVVTVAGFLKKRDKGKTRVRAFGKNDINLRDKDTLWRLLADS